MNLKVESRELDIANSMTTLWLELGYQQVTEQILREKKRLMTELESFVKTNYSNGKSEAQDWLDAQLQVAKLDENLKPISKCSVVLYLDVRVAGFRLARQFRFFAA